VGLSYWDKGSSGTKVNAKMFVIENIDPIDRVSITRGEEMINFRAFSGGFMVNDQFPMDENLLTLLAAVLQQVRVQRPLSGQLEQSIKERIFETGSYVQIYQGEMILSSFWVGGDESKQSSYFATEEGRVYQVHLPGYTSYVSGLFEIPLKNWRSRNIFSNTWRSLMSFSYQDFAQPENDFQINYKDPFFTVSGVQKLDSNHVMNYIQDLVNLQATALVDTTFQGMPWLEFTTVDIDPQKSQKLTLYGDDSQPLVLGKSGEQYFTFRGSNLNQLRRNSQYFER
jgi:hypothetical protein